MGYLRKMLSGSDYQRLKDDECPWCGKLETEIPGLVNWDGHLVNCWGEHEIKARNTPEDYDC